MTNNTPHKAVYTNGSPPINLLKGKADAGMLGGPPYLECMMRSFEYCVIRRADEIKVGDTVTFEMASADYIVEEVENTAIGMIRHQHKSGSSSYWPGELLYVEKA